MSADFDSGTQEIYLQAMREGLVEIIIEAGGSFQYPTCGPCLGNPYGHLAREKEQSLPPTATL